MLVHSKRLMLKGHISWEKIVNFVMGN
jgi:hypothetical protein